MLLTQTETSAARGLTDLFCNPRYYGVGDGILDTHFQPKVGATELREIASMNAPVVLLLAQPEDDLPIPDAAPRFQT